MSLGAIVHAALPSLHGRLLVRRLARDAIARGEPEFRRLPQLCRAGALMLDVGANRGVYSYLARRHGMRVVALEPNPALAQFIRLWSSGSVRVVEAAASNRSGIAHLVIPVMAGRELDGLASLAPSHGTVPGRSLTVRTVRLDDLLAQEPELQDVALMKIDVEGHELEVLEGARRLLETCRPTLIVEAEERHRRGAVESVRRLLEGYGYRGLFYWEGAYRPIGEFSADRHQDAGRVRPDGVCTGDYANNFLYLPERSGLAPGPC